MDTTNQSDSILKLSQALGNITVVQKGEQDLISNGQQGECGLAMLLRGHADMSLGASLIHTCGQTFNLPATASVKSSWVCSGVCTGLW